MKKIIIFNPSSTTYGSERGLLNIIQALQDSCQITVVLPKKGPLINSLKRVKGIKIIFFPLAVLNSGNILEIVNSLFLLIINFFFFLFYINSQQIEIVITNNIFLLFPGLCAKFLSKKHFWHIREITPYKLLNIFLKKYIVLFSSSIICQSNFIRKQLCLPETTSVVYEPLLETNYTVYPKQEAKKELGFSPQKVIISIISRLHPNKGQYEFLRKIERFLKENSNFIILIAGDASCQVRKTLKYKEKILKFISQKKLNNVFLLGFWENISKILSASDICVFPFLRKEPFGIAVTEALSFQKICFYPFRGGCYEIYSIYKKGENLELENIDKLIHFLKQYKPSLNEQSKFWVPEQLRFFNYKNKIKKIYGLL